MIDQSAPPRYQMPAASTRRCRLRPTLSSSSALRLPGGSGLQRRLADRQPDHLGDPHVRRLDLEIAGEQEVGQIVAHEIERQGGVGVDYRQLDELSSMSLRPMHPQPALRALLGGAGLDAQAPGGVVAAGDQIVERPPHRRAARAVAR